jgi:hypothetical protein
MWASSLHILSSILSLCTPHSHSDRGNFLCQSSPIATLLGLGNLIAHKKKFTIYLTGRIYSLTIANWYSFLVHFHFTCYLPICLYFVTCYRTEGWCSMCWYV